MPIATKSIEHTLTRVILLPSVAVLLLTTFAFSAYDLFTFRQANIEHLRTRGAEFSKTEAAVAEKIWDGMMEANQDLIHLRRGEAPPSPHMIQEPPADTGDSGGGIRK